MKKRAISLVAPIIIFLYLAVFAVINFSGFSELLTPDMYSDTLVARMMWEQKTIFPEGWVFGNQYYVVATPVLAALFYGLTCSMNLAMSLATTVMAGLILISLYYLISPFVSKRLSLASLAALCAVVIGIDLTYKTEVQLFFVLASYYACYLIGYFTVVGDYLRGLFLGKKMFTGGFLLSVALCFCLGMQSIRQTIVMILPIVAFEGLRLIITFLKNRKKLNLRQTLRVAFYTLSNIFGVLTIQKLDVPAVTIYGGFEFSSPDRWADNLNTAIRAMGSVTGLRYADDYEPGWFILLFSAVSIAVVIFALVKIAFYKKVHFQGLEAAIIISTLSIVILFVGSIFVNISLRSVYFFVWYALVALCCAYLLRELKGLRKNLTAVLLCILALMNLHYSYAPALIHINDAKAYHSVSDEISSYLVKSDFEIIYGDWASTAQIAAKTDGRIILGAWHNEIFKVLPYINAVDIYTEADNEWAGYLIADGEVSTAAEHAEKIGAELIFVEDFGEYKLFYSTKQLMKK